MKNIGTVVKGIRAPIIKEGDDIVESVIGSLKAAIDTKEVELFNKDVVCVTEAVVARAQGNYIKLVDIVEDLKTKVKGDTVGILFPILSRNRFSLILKAIAQGYKVVVQLSYPSDEVGNALMNSDELEEKDVNPYKDTFTYEQFRQLFPKTLHTFTNIDYIELYRQLSNNGQIILSNDPRAILKYCDEIIVSSIHARNKHKKILKENGATTVLGLDDLMNQSIAGSGYNIEYGLLGSNLADENRLKLFPRDCQNVVDSIQSKVKQLFNVDIEVMVYGDGAFKDPVGGIWELADPVVSPAFTVGLIGQPNELKLKYLADTVLKDLKGEDAKKGMINLIKNKKENKKDDNIHLGTTPRRLTDLLGSLADLTSGSGDKGTPIVLIQNYFSNYSDGNN